MAAPEESAVRPRGRRWRPQGPSLRQLPRSPARETEQSLYVLSRGDHQRLCVHPPKRPETEPPHPVPLLRFPEHGLHPHLALAQRLLVGPGPSVGPDPFEELLLEAAHQHATAVSRRALGLQGQALQLSGLARYLLSLSV
jgi:hypothetical protein